MLKMKREIQLEVICGTYEEFVVGYQLFTYSGEKKVHQFEQTFADHSHSASVRAVTCHGDLLASGAADEIVKLYNMRRRTEIGQLMEHTGTITCLQFHGRHHLLSGSEDGRVAVVRVDNWQCEKYLGRHSGGVTALSVHPTGRLAITAGRDRKLLTWDLMRGRIAYRTNLKAAAEFVLWSPDGSTYAVGVQGRCDVYSVATAGVLHTVRLADKINCAVYLSESLLVCGDESGQAAVLDVRSGDGGGGSVTWQAHDTRLRAAAACRTSDHLVWLVMAASDGWIKIWQAQVSAGAEQPELIASYDTTCRLTCVTLHVPPDKRWPPAEGSGGQTDHVTVSADVAAGDAPDIEQESDVGEHSTPENGEQSTSSSEEEPGDDEEVSGAVVSTPQPSVKRKRSRSIKGKASKGAKVVKKSQAVKTGGSPGKAREMAKGKIAVPEKKVLKMKVPKETPTKKKSTKKSHKAQAGVGTFPAVKRRKGTNREKL